MLVDYVSKNYTADRTVIAAAGPVDHAELVRLAEEHFRHWKSGDPRAAEPKPLFCGTQTVVRNEEVGPKVHFAVGYEGVPWLAADSLSFMVLQSLLGTYTQGASVVPDAMSLNRTVSAVAAGNCCSHFSAFNTCYTDTGMFGFYGICDDHATNDCVEELICSVDRLSYNVTDEEVERAKRALKVSICGALDSTTAIAEDIGRQLLVYGRRVSIPEFLLRLDALDAAEIQRVARKYLTGSDIAATALGSIDVLPDLSSIRKKNLFYRI